VAVLKQYGTDLTSTQGLGKAGNKFADLLCKFRNQSGQEYPSTNTTQNTTQHMGLTDTPKDTHSDTRGQRIWLGYWLSSRSNEGSRFLLNA